MPIPDLSNLPGSSRPGGGGGGVPPSPPSLPKIDNLYSFEFDGVGSYIDAGDITALNSLTAFSTSAWINYSGVPSTSTHIFLSGGSGSSNRFYIELVGSTTIRYGSGATFDDVTISSISSGSWHHIVSVHDGTSLDIYLDGVKQNGSPVTVVAPNTNIGNSFKIGEYFGGSYFWNGYLDEIGLFNIALTQEQVESIYNATTTGKTADLSSLSPVAWYRMGD